MADLVAAFLQGAFVFWTIVVWNLSEINIVAVMNSKTYILET